MARQHMLFFVRTVLWCVLAAWFTGCASTPKLPSVPSAPSDLGVADTPGSLDIAADNPLGHWRLEGGVLGVSELEGTATRFEKGKVLVLEGEGLGGDQLAVEAWVKGARGMLLTYEIKGQSSALVVALEDTVAVSILGKVQRTDVVLPGDAWRLLGVSWRADTGLLVVSVDGRETWRGEVSQGGVLPDGGRLLLGGPRGSLVGDVDDVAVYDAFKHTTIWDHRKRVVEGSDSPTAPEGSLPVRFVLQRGHSGSVDAAAWSPDGVRLATAASDNTVKIWNSLRGALLHDIQTPSDTRVLAWRADGERLVGVSDEAIRVWEARTGQLSVQIDLPEGGEPMRWLSLDLEGQIHAADLAGNITRYDARLGTPGDALALGAVRHVAWQPGVARFAAVRENGRIELFDGGTETPMATIESGLPNVTRVAWSADGTKLAALGCKDMMGPICIPQDLMIWSVPDGKILHNIADAHSQSVSALAWSPSGTRLATVGCDTNYTINRCERGSARVWNTATGKAVSESVIGTVALESVSWSPSGSRVVVGGSNASVTLVQARDGEVLRTLGVNAKQLRKRVSRIHAVLQNPKGGSLAVVTAGCRRARLGNCKRAVLRIWDSATGVLKHELDPEDPELTQTGAAGWSPDGSKLALAGCVRDTRVKNTAICTGGPVLKIWDGQKMRNLAVRGRNKPIRALSWSPDSTLLAVALDKRVEVWNIDGKLLVSVLEGHDERVRQIHWSPNGTHMVSESNGKLVLWDVANSKPTVLLDDPDGLDSLGLAWSPDGGRLAVSCPGKPIELWNARGSKVSSVSFSGVTDNAALAWSPKGNQLAAFVEGDNAVRVWNASTGARLHRLDLYANGDARGLVWSPDGTKLAMGFGGGTRVWEGQSGAMIRQIDAAPASSRALSWSADSARLAIGVGGLAVEVWPVEGTQHATLTTDGEGGWVTYTSDGHFAASGRPALLVAAVQGFTAFSIEQLAVLRNRPDKVGAVLGASDASQTVFNAIWRRRVSKLGLDPDALSGRFSDAPTARITRIAPPTEAGETTVFYRLGDSVGLSSFRVYVNGTPTTPKPIPVSSDRRVRGSVTLLLNPGDNLIEIVAMGTSGLESLRASETVRWEDIGGKAAARLFFLGFGVSDYANDDLDLQFADQDARDLERAMKAMGSGFEEVRTQIFTNAEVTEAALSSARAFVSAAGPRDVLVMFIAGHGVRGTDEARTYYYLDHDTSLDDLAGTAIPFEDMEDLLFGAAPRQKLFLLDTCQSGEDLDLSAAAAPVKDERGVRARAVPGTRSATVFGADTDNGEADRLLLAALRDRDRLIMQDLSRRSGATVLASSLGQESSLEAPKWANGAFTEALLDALTTDVADGDGDGLINTDELGAHVIHAVPKLTDGRQHPNIAGDNSHQRFALPGPKP